MLSLFLNRMVEALFKDEIAVSTNVAKAIDVSREGPVRRFVAPPLWGSTVLALLITLVAGARKILGAAKIWQQMAPKDLECTSCTILKATIFQSTAILILIWGLKE